MGWAWWMGKRRVGVEEGWVDERMGMRGWG